VGLRAILAVQLWQRRRHAWPLLVFTIPMYYILFWLLSTAGSERLRWDTPVQPLYYFLSPPLAVWAVAAIWFAVDLALVVWMERALNRQGEPGRPTRLFFTWQVVKIAFALLLLSVFAAFGPANPIVEVFD